NRHTLLGMLISSNPEHAEDDNWVSIGAGLWDPRGNECWARADRTIEIPEASIQRRGVSMPERRYERLANALRRSYGWS
ncbi:MAG: type II toxin-antitoxin system PemK/MazF family toxin, partial [Corynebacterium sp.]|nr:type II toxin-antitoxin system PemK/MazF family toxin [Corynebacterium sp.]